MTSPNSSGSRERFMLGANEEKIFENIKTGLQGAGFGMPAGFGAAGNRVTVEINSDKQPYNAMNGGVETNPGASVVTLETSEDGTSFSVVQTGTLVYRGRTSVVGNVGKFFKVKNAGPNLAHCVVHAINEIQVQPKVSL